MKHSGLMFTSLALCCSVGHAASEATFEGNTLHMPHVVFMKNMYDVTMTYKAPDKLLLKSATPITGGMPDNPPVKVSDKFKFSITDIALAGGGSYRADVKIVEGDVFKVEGIGPQNRGLMLKGDKITNLGMLADKASSIAYGISDDGKNITGNSKNSKRKRVPVRFDYEKGTIDAINQLGGGRSYGRAINDNGMIAGYANIETPKDAPRIYNAFYNETGIDLQIIPPLGEGKDARAYGINQNGVIVGWSASKADNMDNIAYSYDTASKTSTPLGSDILGGTRSFAFDVNDTNQIVGVATTAEGAANAFLYENGTAKNLGSLNNSGYSEARAINNNGQVTGWSLTEKGNYAAFMYDGTIMVAVPDLGGDAKGYDINTHGHIVGSATDTEDKDHAFLYKDGKLTDLYMELSEKDKSEWKDLRTAYSISDDGVIVGRGSYWTDKTNDKASSRAFRIKL